MINHVDAIHGSSKLSFELECLQCVRDGFSVIDMDTDDKVINLDTNFEDPQLCAIIASDIYKNLRACEVKK
ncbi:unnamed protein product [Linum trigynum]|uniref:Uncharacterized protein n=1 Tax=Linum trigynum TaxID=586398 RepID=A0AAV2D4E0_9ROSI